MSQPNETADRSILTVLSVDMVGSTQHVASVDQEIVEAFMDRCRRMLSLVIEDAGGTLLTFSGDGGLAVFGWPKVLERHAEFACEAALKIQRTVSQHRLTGPLGKAVAYRIGVNTGLLGMRTLELRGGDRLDVTGGAIYVAAALQKAAAPGEVLVSGATRAHCKGPFRFDAMPSASADVDDSAYRLRHSIESRTRTDLPASSGLVGRNEELAGIERVSTTLAHSPTICALIGEPGIGKTRLAMAALSRARDDGRFARLVRCDIRRSGESFALVRSIIETTTDGSGVDDLDVADLLASPDRVRRLWASRLADSLHDRPTTLLIDDYHLSDADSQACLHLLQDAAPSDLAIILTTRPEGRAVVESLSDEVIEIGRLAPVDMETICRELAPDIPAALMRSIVKRADGHPLILEQIVRLILSDADADPDGLPATIASLVHARMNALSPKSRALVDAVAIVGDGAERDLVSYVLGIASVDLDPAIEELRRSVFLSADSAEKLWFSHALITQACALRVRKPRRKSLHERAFRFFEASDHYERIGFHAEQAGRVGEAMDAYFAAVRAAVRGGAAQSVRTLLERAMNCASGAGREADATLARTILAAASTLQQIGEFSVMKTALPMAVEIAARENDTRTVCSVLCQTGNVCWFEGDYAEGLRATSRALELAEDLASLPHVFAAQFMQGNMLFGLGRLQEAIDVQQNLRARLSGPLETARLGAAIIPASQAWTQVGWFLNYLGKPEDALPYVEYSVGIAQAANDPFTEVLARTGLGHVLLGLGENEKAAECVGAAYGLSLEIDYDAAWPHAIGVLAIALSRAGQPDQALNYVEGWKRLGRESRTGRLERFYVEAGYAEALLHARRISEAFQASQRAQAIADGLGNPSLRIEARTVLVSVLETFNPADARLPDIRKERQALLEQVRGGRTG